MSYYNNNDVPPPPHAGWDEEKWRQLIEKERREDEKAHHRILNKILHKEDSYWCICGGRFNAECFGDAFLCLYDHKKDMFKIEEKIYTSGVADPTWSNLSEENRDEWKLKNLTQSAWDEIIEVDSVLSSPTVWNSMSSRERYDWKNKYIKQRDDWISRSLKRLTGDSYEP